MNKIIEPRWYGLFGLALAYPVMSYLVGYIPNPMVPGSILALNMVFLVLAGYFYGPLSGMIAAGLATALAGLLRADQYDALAILPHALMGLAAGLAGNRRSQFAAAASILVGHLLNILFFWRMGLMALSPADWGTTLLGLVSETTVDVVAIILLILLLQNLLYQRKQRW